MVNHIFKIAVVLLALALGLWFLDRLLTSPEERVREALESAVAAFNEPDASDCVSDFASDFRDEVYGLGKRDVHRALASLFLREHRRSREAPYRAEIVDDEIVFEAATETTITATLTLTFQRGKKTIATIDVTVSFEDRDGDWLLAGSAHDVVEGSFPF